MGLTVTPNPALVTATVDVEGYALAVRTKYRLWREDPKYGRVGVTTNTGRTTRSGTFKVGIGLSAYVGTQKIGCELYQSGEWKIVATADVLVQVEPPPPPPSGDLPPPAAGQDAAALIMSTLATRSVRLQSGATYVCMQTINLPNNANVLDLNGATLLWKAIGDGIRVNGGKHIVGGGTLQGAYLSGGFVGDSNHGVNVMGGAGHEFPDVWVRDFQGDAYYLQGNWATGVAVAGNGIRITGGGFRHVGRMGIGVVHYNGGYVADWWAEDSYRPLDFEPDPNSYSQQAMHWLCERVTVKGYIRGRDGSGTSWLNFGSPQRQTAGAYQRIEDIEVRYCDVDNDRDYPHNAISTDNDGAHYRAKDLRVHHNTQRRRWYRGALFEHTDGVLVTDNTGPVQSSPWAVTNDCGAPITNERNA